MKEKILIIALCFVFMFFIVSVANATTLTFKVPIAELDDFDLKTDDGKLKLNNLSIKKANSFMSRTLHTINVSIAAQNRSDNPICFSITIFAGTKDGPIFGLSAEPMMGTISGQTTELIKESVYIDPERSLDGATVWINVIGDFK